MDCRLAAVTAFAGALLATTAAPALAVHVADVPDAPHVDSWEPELVDAGTITQAVPDASEVRDGIDLDPTREVVRSVVQPIRELDD